MWGLHAADHVLAIWVPPTLISTFAVEYYVAGLAAGAVTGYDTIGVPDEAPHCRPTASGLVIL
jgi:hypothetical protein